MVPKSTLVVTLAFWEDKTTIPVFPSVLEKKKGRRCAFQGWRFKEKLLLNWCLERCLESWVYLIAVLFIILSTFLEYFS